MEGPGASIFLYLILDDVVQLLERNFRIPILVIFIKQLIGINRELILFPTIVFLLWFLQGLFTIFYIQFRQAYQIVSVRVQIQIFHCNIFGEQASDDVDETHENKYSHYFALIIDHLDLPIFVLNNFPFQFNYLLLLQIIFKQKATMSIVDIINLNSLILGLSRDGYLLCWDISPLKLAEEDIRQFPFIASHFQYKITDYAGLSLLKSPTNVFMCSQKQIKMIKISELQSFIKRNKNKDYKDDIVCRTITEEHGIETVIILNKKAQEVGQNYEMVDESKQNTDKNNQNPHSQDVCLIYTTKHGKIVSINSDFNNLTTICDIKSNQVHQNLGQYECATSLIPYRQNNLLLVGTSTGRILIVNILFQKVMEDITKRNNLKLTSIRSMILSSGGHKFFSVHQNCIAEWSMELQKCLGYYSYSCPLSVLFTQKLSQVPSKLLISGGNKYIQVVDTVDSGRVNQVESSLQSIHVMKQINGKIMCGGRNSMVEIFQAGIPYLVLFKSEQNIYY